MTLDDGSGQTIEVKFARLPEEITSSVDCPSNTTVDTVNVTTGLGVFRVFADGTELDVATTVKVKGTITSFWNKRQLELKRISIVGSTNEEVSAWAELAAFKRDVLSTPWHLDRQKLDEIEEERRAKKQQEEEQEEQERERHAKKRARRRVHEEKMRVYEAKLEKRRRQEEVMMNAGALDGSDIINWPP